MSRSLLTTLILGSCCIAALAQDTPNLPFPVGDQINAEDDVVPAPADGSPNPANPVPAVVAPKVVREGIQELNMNGDDLAAKYRLYTGKRVLVSAAAAAGEFRIYQPGPLTYTEAASILTKQALMEGFIFVPSGPNEVKLVLAGGQGASPKGEGLPVIRHEDDLPIGDTLVTYVMTLQFIKPDEAIRTFQTVGGTGNPDSSYAPVPNASSILITEKTNLIRKLIQVKETIDVPSAQVSSRWVTLKHADVESVAEILNEIFSGQQSNSNSASVQRNQRGQRNPATPPIPGGGGGFANNGAGGANAGGNGGGSAGEETPPQIIPDNRTNRIFILGRPVDLSFIEGLIKDFDIPDDQRNFLRRKLRYLTVVDFLPIAEDALQRVEPTAASQDGGSAGNTGSRSGRTGGATGGRGQGGGGNSSGGGGALSGVGNTLAEPDIDSAPESIVVGKTLLVADNISNSVIVQGPPQSVEIINKLIDELDVKSDQVMISAVFGQLDRTNDIEWGTNIARASNPGGNQSFSGGRGGGFLDVDDLLRGTAFPTSAGLSLFGEVDNWNLAITALQEDSRFTTLSRPTVFTTNNRKAVLSSGIRIAVPTSTFTNGGTTTANQSTNIEFRNVVLSLEVIPLVNSANEVTLEVALLNDNINGEQDIGGLIVPSITTDEINTYVTVPNGGTIALGGLIRETKGETKDGIPILKDIPVIGNLFKSNNKDRNLLELLVFIQPRIISGPNSLASSQNDLARRLDVSGETYDFANGPQDPVQSINGGTQINEKGHTNRTKIRSLSNRPTFNKGRR